MIGRLLTCKQASELVSQGLDRKLGAGQRFLLGMHLRICRNCERFGRQMEFLRRAVARLPADADDPAGSRGERGQGS